MERHPVILSIAGSDCFPTRTKHTGGTCRTVHFSGYGSWTNRSRDGRPATGCHQNRNDK